MDGRDVRHGVRPRRRAAIWLSAALVVLLVVAAGAAYQLDLAERWFGSGAGTAPADPATVEPPEGVDLPGLARPEPVAEPALGRPDPAKVRRAVAGLLDDPDLGRHVLTAVTGLDGSSMFTSGTGAATPASTLKLLTTTAALQVLGPDHVFHTSVLTDGPRGIVLVGGGDPLLGSRPPEPSTYPRVADVVTLARATAKELKAAGRTTVRLGYDATLFTGPAVNPRWPDSYIPDEVVAPVSALWVDEGRPADGVGRVADPAAAAAGTFAAALQRAGIDVVGTPAPRRAASGATELARVVSPTLAEIVEHTILVSDNEAAEVLAHHVGLGTGAPGSFEGGAQAVLRVVGSLGVPTEGARVYDGSGLSRDNRLDPDTLTAVVDVASDDARPELRPVITGLPVAGFTGSLADRFENVPLQARGVVRAKTGTLSGVSSLAGTVTDRDGNTMVFALMADKIALLDTLDARDALEDLAAALATCRCSP